jgi:protein-S-isoprenylcysteine O-methyltransferase Ste14
LIECFLRFALTAQGTPSPLAPTKRLVVTGLYRHVRNPMYVAVTGLILGQALLFGSFGLLAYGFVVAVGFHLFVVNVEEPRLERDFGEEYGRYRAAVSRWMPRLTPWNPHIA